MKIEIKCAVCMDTRVVHHLPKCRINNCEKAQGNGSRSEKGLCDDHASDVHDLYGYENTSREMVELFIEEANLTQV